MSSVPVQFLIYVLPTPNCQLKPLVYDLLDCYEAQVGVPFKIQIIAENLCDPDDAIVSDIVITDSIPGLAGGTLVQNADQSVASANFTWTPQTNQIGPQTFCFMAFTRFYLNIFDRFH